MNKKFLSAILFGALMVTSTGTFVSCKDYDDDIDSLQEQIDKINGSTISDLQTQLTTLKSAADAAQATAIAAQTAAAEAKTAAAAAKVAGNEAAAAAATAKAMAEEAKAAAAQAKADAIAEAIKQVEVLKSSLQAAIDKKVDLTVYEAAVKALGARIDGIETGLSTLANGAVKENANAIKDAQDVIETLITADQDLQTQLTALQRYAEGVKDIADANAEDIGAAQDSIKVAQDAIVAAQSNIQNLWNEINEENTGLKALIAGNASDITTLTTSTATAIQDLEDEITDELSAIKDDIQAIQSDIRIINNKIIAINGDLSNLHTLIVRRLSSISLAPDLFVDGMEAIRFSSLKYSPMDMEDENATIPATSYQFSTAAVATASYHFNPASFKLENADYGYIDRTAEVVISRAAAASRLVEIVGEPKANAATGTVDFKLQRLNAHSTQPGLDRANMIALQAVLKGDAVDEGETGVVITAPYSVVYDAILDYEDVRIADKKTLTTGGDDAHYAVKFNDCKDEAPRYTMDYDKVFNLKELVATCFGNNGHDEFPIEDYKLSYRFAVASSPYNVQEGATITNQQKWIKCNDAEAGLFQAEGFNPEAFGRTPILKVELVDEAGNVVRRGFVKVAIGVTKQEDLVVGGNPYELTFACSETAASYTITEEFIRENVYRKISNGKETGMSHEEFWNMYEATRATTEIWKNGVSYTMASVPEIVDGATGVGTATKKVVWNFTHGELGKIGAPEGSQFVATITVKNKLTSSQYPEYITFKFIVNVKLPQFTLASTKNEVLWQNVNGELVFFKVNAMTPATIESPAEECLIEQNLNLAYTTYELEGLPACVTDYYKVISTYADGELTDPILSGVRINGTTISLDKNDAAVKAALNSAGGLQASVAHIYTLENGDEIVVNEFMVNFIRPVSLNMPSGITVVDAKTGGDVADFQWNGLLMDWRGEAIVAPSSVRNDRIVSYWSQVCTPQYDWTEGHYEEVTPARLVTTTGVVDMIAAKDFQMYTGAATYRYTSTVAGGASVDKTYTVGARQTQAEIATELYAMALQNTPAGYYGATLIGNVSYQAVNVTAGEHVQYTYVASVTYVPAVYQWIEGKYEERPHVHTDMPAFNGESYGQMSGCWQWTEKVYPEFDWNPGQYWDYYGVFGTVTADVDAATTNLTYNDGKLPAQASLVQEGNTVRYDNVKSPIEYSYEIYIPVSVTYGWGTLNSTLTITVNPVK